MTKFTERLIDYLPNVMFAAIIFIVGYIFIRVLNKLLRSLFKRTKIDDAAWSFLLSLIRAALYVILGVMILSQLKVPMSSIVAALGTAGLAIGLALRDSLSNVAGGFILMMNRPFKAGDFVEISGNEGIVSEITILYTKLLTIDNKAVLIPNGKAASAIITNFTQEELRRLELTFDISYSTDINCAEQAILKTVGENHLALDKPDEPYIRFYGHGENSLKILLRVWVRSEDYWELRFSLLQQIKEEFDRQNISIPFKQLDVHVNS